uniref:Uncharacterized protein n=1 Tax=Aegilops tauschii subsp. strangulata TaxID=200361 RepID=A0A453EQL4_AEGTS
MAREMNGYFSHPPPPPPVPAPYQEEAAADVDDAEDGSGGQGKLCSRGHWRPAEDARLKELVGQYGPQNWNLIAEKLDGRSGNKKNKTTSNMWSSSDAMLFHFGFEDAMNAQTELLLLLVSF